MDQQNLKLLWQKVQTHELIEATKHALVEGQSMPDTQLLLGSKVMILKPNLLISTVIHTVVVPVALMKHFLPIRLASLTTLTPSYVMMQF